MKDLFLMMDTNNNGFITKAEASELVLKLENDQDKPVTCCTSCCQSKKTKDAGIHDDDYI